MSLRHAVHHLTHYHEGLRRENVGTFIVCVPRLTRRMPWGTARLSFRPELSGARWHGVPPKDEHGEYLFEQLMECESPEAAMALLRKARAAYVH